MASFTKTIVCLAIILDILFCLTGHALAGRVVPNDSKVVDKKHPESFGHFDGSVLVPGLGRFLIPKKGSHVNPFTYNPVTGTNGGTGVSIPGIGGTTGGIGGSYVPGGDDTIVPNPGVEVPNPAGGIMPPPAHH